MGVRKGEGSPTEMRRSRWTRLSTDCTSKQESRGRKGKGNSTTITSTNTRHNTLTVPSMATGAPIRRFAISTRCLFHSVVETPQHTSTSFRRLPSPHVTSRTSQAQSRSLSSTPRRRDPETDTERAERPRWQQTPRGMSMPVRIRSKPKNNEWTCNSDPRKLDAMYVRLLGEGGEKLLSEEAKWLAITHKSFDQGRRGFNDRLSYLGMLLFILMA